MWALHTHLRSGDSPATCQMDDLDQLFRLYKQGCLEQGGLGKYFAQDSCLDT